MNKQTFIEFIKKYPMSILLAIIAINLYSIGGSLKMEKDINRDKLFCIDYYKGITPFDKIKKQLKKPKMNKDYSGKQPEELCRAILGS